MAIKAQKHITVLPSAARTADNQSADQANSHFRGLRLWIKTTAESDTASVVFTIQGKSPQGDYFTILASAAVTTLATTTLLVHPDIAASANAIANTVLPSVWRVDCNHDDADSITYSVMAEYLL